MVLTAGTTNLKRTALQMNLENCGKLIIWVICEIISSGGEYQQPLEGGFVLFLM